jgi:hydrogenase-4 component E
MVLFFITIVFLHLAKKNSWVPIIYSVQSLIIIAFLASAFLQTKSVSLLFIALLLLIVKVIAAPVFITRFIKQHKLKFMVSTYLNMPLTLIVVALLTAIANSNSFIPLTTIIPANQQMLSLALASLLISIFLIVNRKGALSQIFGILSLENSIVAFAFFAGLEQALTLQIGILFDIAIWMAIATIFISMIYKHFGSLDVTEMQNLTE